MPIVIENNLVEVCGSLGVAFEAVGIFFNDFLVEFGMHALQGTTSDSVAFLHCSASKESTNVFLKLKLPICVVWVSFSDFHSCVEVYFMENELQ